MDIGIALGFLKAEFTRIGYVGEVRSRTICTSERPEDSAIISLLEPEATFTVWPDGRIEDHNEVFAHLGEERVEL